MSGLTEDEAKTKICPLSFSIPEMRGNDGSGIREGGPWNCNSSACMAWRWSGAVPPEPARNVWWPPETDDETVLRSADGPARPSDAGAAAWVPMSGGEEDQSWEGGYWQELAEEHRSRIDKARATRKGFCGAFGKPS